MSKKSKGVILESAPCYGVGVYEDARARLKHQTLLQDYVELQKEVDVIRSKLEAGKQRKMILAAEVRFLRRRYEYFMKTKAMNSLQLEKPVQPTNLLKHTKHMKEFSRKEASQHMLPPIPKPKRKKKQHIGKQVSLHGASPISSEMLRGGEDSMQHILISDLNYKGRIDAKKKALMQNTTQVLDLNQKERMHANDTSFRNTSLAFDLNQDNNPRRKEASLPSRAPVFDLNEISTGDEDLQCNVEAAKFEEAKRSLMRHPNDEMQNDLMLSVCRNAGEVPSRVGKRKISWQDPVALRV